MSGDPERDSFPPAGEGDSVPPGDAEAPPPDGGTAAEADDRESAYGLFQRGQELLHGRHYAQAAIVLERAAAAAPGKGSILEALGRAYFNSRQHERARETFERLLEVDPSAHYGHFALGESLRKLGRDREARTHLRLAVALHPRSATYRNALRRATPPDEAAS